MEFLNLEFCVIGHRGAAGLVPENTLPSFRCALDHGCPMLELDVHSVASSTGNTLIVLHDEELERTTSGRGNVAAQTLTSLRTLDAGGGAQIPLLDEIADLLAAHAIDTSRRTVLNIELKGADTAAPCARFATEHPDLPILVSSFDHDELRRYRKLRPEDWLAPLYARYRDDWQATAAELGACAINLSARIATPARIRAIRDAGYAVFVYTVNRLDAAQKLARAGASGVFTDRPDRLLTDGRWRGA